MQSRIDASKEPRLDRRLPEYPGLWMTTIKKKTPSRLEENRKTFPPSMPMMVKSSLPELTCCMEATSSATSPTHPMCPRTVSDSSRPK